MSDDIYPSALTPLDGRNQQKISILRNYFSDVALNKNRVQVEIVFLKKLSDIGIIRHFTLSELALLSSLFDEFSEADYRKIREIEKVTKHDVQAVVVYLQQALQETSLSDITNYVHLGLTSEDINGNAYGIAIADAIKTAILPEIMKIENVLDGLAHQYRSTPMIGRTHGQPAAPTTVGKEFRFYHERLSKQVSRLKSIRQSGKLTGNTGNLNALFFLFPEIDWVKFSAEFVKSLGLEPELITNQLNPHDALIETFNVFKDMNNLLIGLCKDMWIYIMLDYFRQEKVETEVGSTALPHKINPIFFEGAEGGFGIANALFNFYIEKLSYSRLQRDLSDSTVKRSFGIAFGYSLLSYQSVNEALSRISVNQAAIIQDLQDHWEILSEPINNYLKSRKMDNSYEAVKTKFRGKNLNRDEIINFIDDLDIDDDDKAILKQLNPETYLGLAERLASNNED